MWRSFPKILQPVYFLPFYFLHAIYWCSWEEKYSCFLLGSLWPLSPFPGGQKRLLRRPGHLLTQPAQQGHKDVSDAMLQRRYCCLYDRQVSAQKGPGWFSLVSKFYCLEISSLMKRFDTKLGLLLSYTWCHAGLGQTGHKVRRDDGAELPRGVLPSRDP